MAIRITNFAGERPRVSSRDLGLEGSQINSNLLATSIEFRPVNAPVRVFLGQAVPEPSIDNLQIRLALSDLGLREAVEAAVAASSQEIKDWWAESLRFLKSDPMVRAMAENLKVTSEQLDALWQLGATK